MRRERKLMILTGVLVVCAAGAFGISRIDFEEKMTGTETTIVDADSADIMYLAWNGSRKIFPASFRIKK